MRVPVVISGLGLFTPETWRVKDFYQQIADGTYQGRKHFLLPAREIQQYFPHPKDLRFARAGVQYGMGALREALRDASLSEELGERGRIGVFYGEFMPFKPSLKNMLESLAANLRQEFDPDLYLQEMQRTSIFEMLKNVPNISAFIVASNYQITGPALTFLNGCAAGAVALLEAFEAIASGQIDLALVVSGHGERNRLEQLFWAAEGLFGAEDFSEGEVGTALILEREATAMARGVEPYARVRGGLASWVDLAEEERLKERIEGLVVDSLGKAGLTLREIDYLNRMVFFSKRYSEVNDQLHQRLFPENGQIGHIWREWVGHTFAASGLVEVIGALAELAAGQKALVNTVGYGGYIASLAMEGLR